MRYINRIDYCPAVHLKRAAYFDDKIHVDYYVPWTKLPIVGLADVEQTSKPENNAFQFTTKISAIIPNKLIIQRDLCFRLTTVTGERFVVGIGQKPFVSIEQVDKYPSAMGTSAAVTLQLSWISRSGMLLMM